MTSNKTTLAALETRVDALTEAVTAYLASVGVSLAVTEVAPEVIAPTVAEAVTEAKGLPIAQLRLRLKEHKAAGAIPAGVTAKEALAQGLMDAHGNLPGAAPEPKKAKAKATGKAKVTAPEGPSFMDLRGALKAHKAAGAIKSGVTVKEAIEQGLMRPDGTLPSAPTVAVVAQVVADAPAKVTRERAPEPKYGTKAWIAWARPTDDGAPRRADGTATPKSEWKARMSLAKSGAFTAKEIDEAVKA